MFEQKRKVAFSIYFICVLTPAFLLYGCLGVKSYVDPKFRQADYFDLKQIDDPQPITLIVKFQVNGERKPELDNRVYQEVERVIRASRLFSQVSSTPDPNIGKIEITLNNIADTDKAVSSGCLTGATFGAAGSLVIDKYYMSATYTPPNRPSVVKGYHHALHSTIGMKEGPQNMKPTTADQGFNQVVEDMMLNFLRDIQSEKKL